MASYEDQGLRHNDPTLRHKIRPRYHRGRDYAINTDYINLQSGPAITLQSGSFMTKTVSLTRIL